MLQKLSYASMFHHLRQKVLQQEALLAPAIVGIKTEVNISNFMKNRVPTYLKEDFP
jgi:hypothetical protein